MARYRGTTTERLGAGHAADLKRLRAAHRDGDPCWRCGQPMYSWQALERDHLTPRALGGIDGPAVLAHASCNRSAGAKLGNELRGFTPAVAIPGRDVTCAACGKPYHYAARSCEMCGAHYHPSYGEQRTCGRACGRELRRRNGNLGAGAGTRRKNWPSSKIRYYTCRYCGEPGILHGRGGQRDVCPAPACQRARLQANDQRWRTSRQW